MGRPLTTGEIARICQASQATMLNWIRDQELAAFTTPGRHYRLLPADLQEFATRDRMPIELTPEPRAYDRTSA